MIPILETKLSSELFNLENYIINHSCDIEHWFRMQWLEHTAPFYASVDLRNSGFKLTPVDTNLFPGGFNNLNPDSKVELDFVEDAFTSFKEGEIDIAIDEQWFPLHGNLKFIPAFSLIGLHLYNLRYCQCKAENCC